MYPGTLIERTFAEREASSAQRIVARSWTEHGDLPLRGVGITASAPHILFGYEVLASHLWTVPHYQLLRAYRKRVAAD